MRQLELGKRLYLKNKGEKDRERERGREGEEALLFSPLFELIGSEISICCSDGVSVLPGS